MSWRTPTWWQAVILLLGAARLTRLIGWDDLTIPLRRRVTGLGDEQHKQWAYVIDHQKEIAEDPWNVRRGIDGWATNLAIRMERATGKFDLPPIVKGGDPPSPIPPVSARRYYLSKMIRCPWCVGFWISVAGWLAWLAWPHAITILAVPLAISEAVGLISKNLDP